MIHNEVKRLALSVIKHKFSYKEACYLMLHIVASTELDVARGRDSHSSKTAKREAVSKSTRVQTKNKRKQS